jgi:hypothetical protein
VGAVVELYEPVPVNVRIDPEKVSPVARPLSTVVAPMDCPYVALEAVAVIVGVPFEAVITSGDVVDAAL